MWLAPKDKVKLSASELIYGRPIPKPNRRDTPAPLKWIISSCPPGRRNRKALTEHGDQTLPDPTNLAPTPSLPLSSLGALQNLENQQPQAQLPPKWTDPTQ